MGRRLFNSLNISATKTEKLKLDGMIVVPMFDGTDDSDYSYHVVHESYFSKEKPKCPYCGASHANEKKIRERKYKDILPGSASKENVIDLIFHQRYFKCPSCGHVFGEDSVFAEDNCRYTNRLSDLLAEGTLTKTYEQVCKDFGVPSSKTSVGIIMRRRLNTKLQEISALKTPETLIVVISHYYSCYYPLIFGIYDDSIRFIDILKNSSQSEYMSFFSLLERDKVKSIFIDPDEQLSYAASLSFPNADILMSEECVLRVVRESFKEIIRKEGARCLITNRYHIMCQDKKYLSNSDRKRLECVLNRRHRLHAAYDAYQAFLPMLDDRFCINALKDWSEGLFSYLQEYCSEDESEPLTEFDELLLVIELYHAQISAYIQSESRLPKSVRTKIRAFLDALDEMPFCIFDVLHARILLNVAPEIVHEDETEYRAGIIIDNLVKKMNEISRQIRLKKESMSYEYE